ncbi:MAG: hypothetical protein ABIR47_07690 [Candidatus Kapaibacterium sp.]
MNRTGLFGVALATMLSGATLIAQTTTNNASGMFSFQGRLMSSSNTTLADGQHSLTVKIYAKGSGSGSVYSETDQVTTINGIFSTMIGDNGNGGAKFSTDANASYEIGLSVDNGSEMSPRIQIGDAISSISARVAANANAVGGFRVDSTNGTSGLHPNTLVTTDANGRINSSLLGNSVVTSINGLHGNINLQVSGSGVSTDTTGGVLHLNITGGGSGGGSLTFPFSQNGLSIGSGDVFSLSNAGSGSVGNFTNIGTGSAINATSNLSLVGSGTINATNSGTGSAINASSNSATSAALRIQNRAAGSMGQAISALDANGTSTFNVLANGQTTINSTVANALNVTTSASGEAALAVNGGLKVNGPVGTGMVDLSNGSSVVNNVFVKSNSIIMITVTSITGGTTALPLRVSSQGNGTFTVSAIQGALGSLTGNLSFNYLVINQ